ncbi:MAG: oligosaccharide flippase family protein, partial [Bacteroidetes bacterium]|nr:oligosaccharide flippase family protein [Bacteroidota bacterium]
MTSARDGIVANVRLLAGANLFVKPVWFAFLLLSTRFLGPEEFGKFMFALSYVGILTYVLEGGIDVFALREISARPESLWQVFPNTLLLKCVSGVAVGVVALLSTIFTGVSREAQILIAIAVLHGILNNLLVHGRFVFRALEIMRFEAYSIVVEKGAIVLICGIALFVYPTAAVFLAAFVIAYALATSATFLMLRRQTRFSLAWTPWPTLWKAVLKPALPFALMGIFMVVYFRAGTLMLQWLTGSEANIGYFNAGYRLVEAFALLPTIMVMPLYATFTRERSDKVIVGQRVHQSARGLLAVSLFVAVPFVFFSRDMTLLLYGPAYLPASQAIGVTVLTIVPVGMTWLFVHLAGAVGRQRILNYFIVGITL